MLLLSSVFLHGWCGVLFWLVSFSLSGGRCTLHKRKSSWAGSHLIFLFHNSWLLVLCCFLFWAGTSMPGESRDMEIAAGRFQHNQQTCRCRDYQLPKAWSVCCTGCFFSMLKGLFLSTGYSGGSASLESVCSSHSSKQNKNGYYSDSPFLGNARNILNWYSKPFPASD